MTQSLREALSELVKLAEKARPGWSDDDAALAIATREFLSRSEELRLALENDARYRWLRENVKDGNVWQDVNSAIRFDDSVDRSRKEKP